MKEKLNQLVLTLIFSYVLTAHSNSIGKTIVVSKSKLIVIQNFNTVMKYI